MHRNFKIYKPYGYLSQFITNQRRRRNKKMLGELGDFPEGTMAAGRLDEDSEGLLLLTTHGKTSSIITSKSLEKEYYVQVDGEITQASIKQLQEGVEIGIHGKNYVTLPCQARKLLSPPLLPARSKPIRSEKHGPTSWISITLTEGKFRQVKKMTAAVGFPTLRLIRIRIGNEHLNGMQPGTVEEVKEFTLQ